MLPMPSVVLGITKLGASLISSINSLEQWIANFYSQVLLIILKPSADPKELLCGLYLSKFTMLKIQD